MLNNKSIAVVIPAFNEANQIKMVLDGIPDFVDRIVVVDDNSKDNTIKIVEQYLTYNNSDLEIPYELSKKIDNSPYNKADLELRNKSINELTYFTPHNCFNENPANERIIVIKHDYNAGVGAAIST